jgi:hypothetical protein
MHALRTIPFALLLAAPVLSWGLPATAQPAAGLDRPLLVHGNYCGPGNNAPLPPIDALDAACARHDACSPTGGLPSKACNLRLEREASAIARDSRQSPDLRAMAGLISASIAMLPTEKLVRPVTHRAGGATSQAWDIPADGED